MSVEAAYPVRYHLASHVRACRIDNEVIMLDLRRNRYLGVGGPHLQALSRHIAEWPADASDVAQSSPCPGIEPCLERLVGQQILTKSPPDVVPIVRISDATETLIAPTHVQSPRMVWRTLLELGWSAAVASRWLKRLSLMEIANLVGSTRARFRATQDSTAEKLRDAVSSYARMRPFVLTAHDQCLHDSLTLIRFLALHRLHPHWVIGVRTRPFIAHSWVQSGSVVLNDLHENVRAFRPILVV